MDVSFFGKFQRFQGDEYFSFDFFELCPLTGIDDVFLDKWVHADSVAETFDKFGFVKTVGIQPDNVCVCAE
jgi:hypothetical protein